MYPSRGTQPGRVAAIHPSGPDCLPLRRYTTASASREGSLERGSRAQQVVGRGKDRGDGEVRESDVGESGVMVIPTGRRARLFPPAFFSPALRESGLWQSGAKSRCANRGYGRNGAATTPNPATCREERPVGARAGLPQPPNWQRADRGNCHSPHSRNVPGRRTATTPIRTTHPAGAGSPRRISTHPSQSRFSFPQLASRD